MSRKRNNRKVKVVDTRPLIKIEPSSYGGSKFYAQYLHKDKDGKSEYSGLCYVNSYKDKEFFIERPNFPYEALNGLERIKFETPELAAQFMYQLIKFGKPRNDIKATDETLNYVKSAIRSIHERAKIIRSQSRELFYETALLKSMMKSLHIPLEIFPELPEDDAAARVRDLTLQGDDVPFFSESKLYELLGKEDARQVLAVIERLLEKTDPVAALKI
jgi:hypothetical protein